MANEMLVELFKQNLWANLRLLDACAHLAPEAFALSVPGTYGPIGATLTHILRAEQGYVRRLTGETRPDRTDLDKGFPGIGALRDHAQWSGERLVAAAARTGPEDVFESDYEGKRYATRKLLVLVQAFEHGTEHRAHVTVTMSSHGITPPALDGWSFGEAAGHTRVVG